MDANANAPRPDPGTDAELVAAPPAPVAQRLPPSSPAGNSLLHPLSGLLILAIDYAAFGGEALTAGLGLPLTCLLSFALSAFGVFLVQYLLSDDPRGKAMVKAFIGGVVTGMPTPVSGTILGGVILGISGIGWLSRLGRWGAHSGQ